ncbi:MAG: prolyl hydroxylase family protein [Sphingobium sp.]
MFRRKPPKPDVDDGDQPSAHRAGIGKRVAAKLKRNPMVERVESDLLDLFIRRDFLSGEECAAMRAIIDEGAQPSKLFSGTEGPEYRTSHSCHMEPDDPLVAAVSDRIVALMGLDAATGETIQGQRYTVGQEYKPHWDYFPVNDTYWPHMKAQGGQRCWTAMAYLSNVAAGGETHFPYAGLVVPPREGTIIIWNNLTRDGGPNHDSLHAALPVRDGTKYVLTKWFREREWIAGAKARRINAG